MFLKIKKSNLKFSTFSFVFKKMSNLGRIKPKYISLGLSNDQDDLIDASIHIDWPLPTINKLDNYVVCIERMEISLNAIPFYKHDPQSQGDEQIIFFNRADAPIGTYTLSENYYTLWDLQNKLSSVEYQMTLPIADPITGVITPTVILFNIYYGMDEIGRTVLDITSQTAAHVNAPKNFQNFYIRFPTYLNMILGFQKSNFDQLNTGNGPDWGGYATSFYPQLDCGDNLNHIYLTSTLPVISDSIQVVQSNVLTDTCPPSSYSPDTGYITGQYRLEGKGWTLNTRQKFIYIPQQRRYLDLIAPFSLRYLQLDCWYMSNDQTSSKVQLPPGGTFQIKLGFYQK